MYIHFFIYTQYLQTDASLIFHISDASRGNGPNYIILAVAAVCITALLLPTEGDESTLSFKLSVQLKLVFSYVLGKDSILEYITDFK